MSNTFTIVANVAKGFRVASGGQTLSVEEALDLAKRVPEGIERPDHYAYTIGRNRAIDAQRSEAAKERAEKARHEREVLAKSERDRMSQRLSEFDSLYRRAVRNFAGHKRRGRRIRYLDYLRIKFFTRLHALTREEMADIYPISPSSHEKWQQRGRAILAEFGARESLLAYVRVKQGTRSGRYDALRRIEGSSADVSA